MLLIEDSYGKVYVFFHILEYREVNLNHEVHGRVRLNRSKASNVFELVIEEH